MRTRFETEEFVRRSLGRDLQTTLSKKKLQVGVSSTGQSRFHEFDCVSPDGQIVAEIKTNGLRATPQKPDGRYFSAIKWSLIGDLYMLSRVSAKRKHLVLTDEPLFKICSQDMDGMLPENTQILLKTLPCDQLKAADA